ncbi:MAG TPA: hypothetical protein VMJ34_02230 [Bryobacteraceae bacterium]|nr:hypothetical protein [Bryobacteraceae bacterium]
MLAQTILSLSCLLPLAFALAAQPEPSTKVLASAEHEAGGVKVELLEVKRDSPTVVTARWRYRNETAAAKRLTRERTGSVDAYRLSLNSYLLDETRQVKYPVSRESAHHEPVASRNGNTNSYITIGPKAIINVWAKYIVPETTSTVTVTIEGVLPFSGIAITH